MDKLKSKYQLLCSNPSDINEHIPTLYEYAKKCDSIIELGVRGVVSTYAFALGLMHNNSDNKSLLINDIEPCDINELKEIISDMPIEFKYEWISDLELNIEKNYDMTFIDTFHVYGLLKRELDKYSKITNKYIIMHDTTVDGEHGELHRYYGHNNDILYKEASGISSRINIPAIELLQGLNKAVIEFLDNNNNWVLEKRFENNNGLTILRRIQ